MPSTQATGLQTAAHETIDIATHRRRVVISGVIGTSIEWFDFLLYGLIAPAVFDRLFFPKLDPVAGTIAVLGVFAVGWMARPLGESFSAILAIASAASRSCSSRWR